MKQNAIKIIFIFFSLILAPCSGHTWLAKFKQEAELYIVDGKVEKSEPHVDVNLNIQKDKVIYGEIEDWKRKTKEFSGAEFVIVSRGKTWLTNPEADILGKAKSLYNKYIEAEDAKTQYVIRAIYHNERSVNFLIIGETYLLEVKNSVFFGNAINYLFYKRIR